MTIHVTDVGKQIAISGLMPVTAHQLLEYVVSKYSDLTPLIQKDGNGQVPGRDIFDFCLLFAALSSSEFTGLSANRYLHWGLSDPVTNSMADNHSNLLIHYPWQGYLSSANAAKLMLDWINGVSMPNLEGQFEALRAGKIQGMAKEASWCLSGFAEILAAATKNNLSDSERPIPLRAINGDAIEAIKRIIPAIRLLAWRLNVGFPAEILWMSEIKTDAGKMAVTRSEAVALYNAGLFSYTDLRQRNNWQSMIQALLSAVVRNTQSRAQEIQRLAHSWHERVREKTREKLIKQSPEANDIICNFFDSREMPFQRAFENLLNFAGISFTLFDDGTRPGAFDYILHIPERSDFIIECKTRQENSLVDLGDARTVLGAASQYGYDETFCATLCNPGINPDILADFSDCSRLAILEAHDIATALIRVATQKLTPQGFHDWIVQPGLVKAENIYIHSNKPESVLAANKTEAA